jgi:ubiquitin-protein ligase
MSRIRLLIDNFVDAMTEGKKSGSFDIAQVDPDNFEEYYILFKPLAGIYRDQWQIINMKTTYGSVDKYMYPNQAPLVKFLTKVFHTNISTSGSICLDILKDNTKWMPTYSFSQIILNIMLLYMEPNTGSPFNGMASCAYAKCRKVFKNARNKNTSLAEEEKLRDSCFEPYKIQSDRYANSDLSKFSKWFPQIVNKEHTTEDAERRRDIAESVAARRAAIERKKKDKESERKTKNSRSKINRWSKYQKKKTDSDDVQHTTKEKVSTSLDLPTE